MEKNFKLNIQLFAGEETESEPTETVENDSTETTEVEETPEKDDVDFEDSDKKETDSETTKKANFQAAQRRIAEKQRKQEEARKRELEAEKKKSYIEGIKRSSGGINRFTQKPIVDDDDVAEYELMLKLDAEGKDPIDSYLDAIKEQHRNERLKAQEKAEQESKEQQKMDKDVSDFVEKYGSEAAVNLSKDKDFMEFADDMLGKIPLTSIYSKYLKYTSKLEALSDAKALEKDARRMSSSGGLGKEEMQQSYSSMSREDFKKVFDSTLKNY